MRILFLSQIVPYPADAGPKVRSYYVLQYLASRGHEITLLAFSRPDDRPEDLTHLHKFCSAVYTIPMQRSRFRDIGFLLSALITKKPFLILRDSVKEMHTTILKLLAGEKYDAIHADQLWMAQYALAVAEEMGHGQRIELVLDQHNAVHMIPQRMAMASNNRFRKALLLYEARKLAQYEAESCRLFEHVIWVTEEDCLAVQKLGTKTLVTNNNQIIPICIDLEDRPVLNTVSCPFRVTFIGGLHWPPNAEGVNWFYQEVWPQISAVYTNSIFTVIGKHPPESIASTTLANNNLEVTGYVADPTRYLEETAVFIVPLHAGGGMRVKILDAWAWGLPIVSTTIGAEGLCYDIGEDLLVADSANEFAQAVLQILSHPDTATRLREKGRRTVENLYNWRTIYPEWEHIYTV